MRGFNKALLWTAAILGAIGATLYLTLFDVWRVPADDPSLAVSVEPVLSAGDLLIISRSTTSEPGSLVRCPDPDAAGRFVVARIAGGPSSHVQISQGLATINGKSLSGGSACDKVTLKHPVSQEDVELGCGIEEAGGLSHQVLRGAKDTEGTLQIDVSAGKVYLLSDNRYMHLDSRDFGQISSTACQHILLRVWGAAGFFDAKKRFTFIF